MSKYVVADSSCLIVLSKIGKLEILREIFERIYIPEAVFYEVVDIGKGRVGAQAIKKADWIECVTVENSVKIRQLNLDAGETEAIALASEKQADFIILDDRRARKAAVKLSLPVIGTIAVLKKAEEKHLVTDLPAILEDMAKVGFHFSLKKMGQSVAAQTQ